MSTSSRRRARAARVTIALTLLAAAIVIAVASWFAPIGLTPALITSLVAAIIGVRLVHNQMIEDRHADAASRARIAQENRDSATAASHENTVFVRTLHDQVEASQHAVAELVQSRDQERVRAEQAELFAQAQTRRADALARRVDDAETENERLRRTIDQHAEVDWNVFDASWFGRNGAPVTHHDAGPMDHSMAAPEHRAPADVDG